MPRPTMVAQTLVQHATGALPAGMAAPSDRSVAPRWPHREDLLPVGYYLLVAAVLATTGTSAWRIAILALAAAGQQVGFFAWRRPGLKHCVNADPERAARGAVLRASSTFFVTTGLAIAATGGVGSPLLVTFLVAYLAAVTIVGDRGETRWLLAATALGVCVLAVLPRSWTGVGSPRPVHALLAAVSVLGVGALLVPVHATRRKKLEELERARSELASEALARAQTLEQIGSKVAHELKNPLTGVKALVQLGLRNPAEGASHDRLEVVEREVSRMQEILQNYLSFTRPLQGVEPRRVDLGPLVSDTLEVLSARANDARVRLYADGDAMVEADPRRLREALLNLVANAIEATPPGGEVFVEVRAAAEGAELVVRDTGRGMPPEVLGRIGTPFFTTRDDGTGLGVVLARSVIAQHGGSLRYESEPGKGTRVEVTLPRVAREGRDGACAGRR
ncbi:two-component system sensor histidine kinase NtrB [Anaeromyxobacter oryzae]|nr:HAMP domain-containing sensor histidine kinase [Anaeromyxobacter oryzae]